MIRNSWQSTQHPLPIRWRNGFHLLSPPRVFDSAAPEWIDRPEIDPAKVREELHVLEDANRHFGGHHLALHYIKRLVAKSQARPVKILDLGTGAGDIPRAIAAWSAKRQTPVAITAVDRNPSVLRVAKESSRNWPQIQFEQHDLLALPIQPKTFDIVLCSLALHHFGFAEATTVLRRMQEIARVGYIVNDLRRNWLSIWMTQLMVHTVIRSDIVRNDAPQSCRAAFSVSELHALARQAGLKQFRIRRHHLMFRMVLEGWN